MQAQLRLICVLAIAAAAPLAALPARGADILTEWGSVKIPPPPELKKVTIDPKTTALLIFDLMKSNCGVRPRCPPIVPNVKRLLDQARAHGMLVAYTLVGDDRTPNGMIDPSLSPREGDHIIENARGGDKFAESSLNPVLKAHGIKTVIITGTSFQGAVATSANGATELGYHAVVPVDGTASEDAFNELYAAYHVGKGGPAAFTRNATLTRSDLIDFGK
jgi:nicotinamidase-related amidase